MLVTKSIELFVFFLPIGLTCLAEILYKWIYKDLKSSIDVGHRARITGILLMIIGFFVFVYLNFITIDSISRSFSWEHGTLKWVLLLIVMSVLAGVFINHRLRIENCGVSKKQMPAFKGGEHLLVWMMYLLMYEFYFRYLLFPQHAFSLITAIGINIIFYVLAHVHHGRSEAIAAIPYGIVLCLVTLVSQNLWPAYLGHLALAFTVQFVGPGHVKLKFKRRHYKNLNQQS